MNWPPSDFSLAIACGVDGAFVDVTEWLLFDVTYREGRESPFVDTTPGTFAFSLVNEDGRFTPGNTATLATPLVEGMRVCWQVGDRLVTGQIRAFTVSFGDVANAETARVRITCVDVLGLLARQELVALWDQMVESAGLFARWTFADAVGSNGAVESGPNFLPPLQTVTGATFAPPTFGASSLPWIDETQALLSVTPSVGVALSSAFNAAPFDYDTDSGGVYGFWLTITDGTPSIRVEILQVGGTRIWIELNGSGQPAQSIRVIGNVVAVSASVVLELNVPYYVTVEYTLASGDYFATLRVDGTTIGTATDTNIGGTALTPRQIQITSASSTGSVTISRLTHTRTLVPEQLLNIQTEADAITALAAVVDGVTFATPSTDLSQAPVVLDTEGQSALDALNDIARTEQGYVYVSTTGTLTAPVDEIVLRERTRPADVDYTFTTTTEISGSPVLERDLSQTVSSVTANGPEVSVTVTDATLTALVGQANRSEDIILVDAVDLVAWSEDRLIRGTNTSLEVRSFTVDARGTATDRWDDLLAMRFGDRVRVAGLPEAQLGFDTYDGWLIGRQESHTAGTDPLDGGRNSFTLHIARALADTAIFDTNRFVSDGGITLDGAITSSATFILTDSVTSDYYLSSTDEPYTIQIDDEQMTVTNVAASFEPQVLTVTRGVNGTTAAAHADGALVSIVPDSLFAF